MIGLKLIHVSKRGPRGPNNNNNPTVVNKTAWRRIGDKPLSEPEVYFTEAYMRHSTSMS